MTTRTGEQMVISMVDDRASTQPRRRSGAHLATVGRNWAGNIVYGARSLSAPTTVEQVQSSVADATSVRALGSRHSFNDIADSPGDLITVSALEGSVIIDQTAGSATFPAGWRYGDLATVLDKSGWALANMASLPHISVAGAVATATHGSGDTNPTLAAAVTALTLVIADGSILQLDRSHADFPGAVVGLGALGMITEVTLEIVPTFAMRQDLYMGAPLEDIANGFDEASAAGYSVSINPPWGALTQSRIRVKSRGDVAPKTLLGRPRSERDDDAPLGSTNRIGAPGRWLDRLPHFTLDHNPSYGAELQSEYFLDRRLAGAALRALHPLEPEFGPALYSAELRTIRADDLWLSPAYQQDTVGLHFTWRPDPALVHSVVPVVERALAPFEPRTHWAKIAHQRPGHYPRMDDFHDLRARLDPTGKFVNAHALRTGLVRG
jgi:xylitol oxidase